MKTEDLETMSTSELREKAPARLTIKEAIAILRISSASFYRLREDGAIPGVYRLGGRTFIERDALLDWLDDLTSHDERESPLDSVA